MKDCFGIFSCSVTGKIYFNVETNEHWRNGIIIVFTSRLYVNPTAYSHVFREINIPFPGMSAFK